MWLRLPVICSLQWKNIAEKSPDFQKFQAINGILVGDFIGDFMGV